MLTSNHGYVMFKKFKKMFFFIFFFSCILIFVLFSSIVIVIVDKQKKNKNSFTTWCMELNISSLSLLLRTYANDKNKTQQQQKKSRVKDYFMALNYL